MKTTGLALLCAAIAVFVFSGCSTGGMFAAGTITSVELAEPNFVVVAENVQGEAEAGYILGATYGVGAATQTLALARVSGTGMLYSEALSNLWKNFEQRAGNVKGRKLALTNVRFDSDNLNIFLLYTRAHVSIRADVVEFQQ